MKRHRVVISGLVCAGIVCGIMLIPVPHYVRCPFIVQAQNAENIYVEMPGTMQDVHVDHGELISAGQVLLTLENNDLDSQISKLQGRIESKEIELNTLKRSAQLSVNEGGSVNELEVARVELETAKADLKQRAEDLQRLQVVAKKAGYLIPPSKVQQQDAESVDLGQWHGYPLEQRNRGCFLESSTLVGRIVPDLRKLEAVLTVDQSDIEYVQSGQQVELLPHTLPWLSVLSETDSIASTKMKSVPKGLSSRFGGDLVTTKDDNGVDVPQSATFQISVPFDCEDLLIVDGCTGKAKIRTGSQTIGQRVWRLAQKTFRFDL